MYDFLRKPAGQVESVAAGFEGFESFESFESFASFESFESFEGAGFWGVLIPCCHLQGAAAFPLHYPNKISHII